MTQNDRIAAGRALVDKLEPLKEIGAIVGLIERDRTALSGVNTECATCDSECTRCRYYSRPSISLAGDNITPLNIKEAVQFLPIYNKILKERITSNIKRLEKLVATIKASETEAISTDIAYKEEENKHEL